MSSVAAADVLGVKPQRQPRTEPEPYIQPESKIDNEADEMTQRRLNEDEVRMIARVMREESVNGNGNKKTTIFLGAIALATFIGGAGNFLTSTGILLGSKNKEADTYYKQAEEDHRRLDNLRILYLLKFSEDPDKVDIEARQKQQDREKLREDMRKQIPPKRR